MPRHLLPLLGMLLWASAGSAGGGPAVPATVAIAAGPFIAGSDGAEREAAYRLDEAAYGHDRTRQWGWYDDERPRGQIELPLYHITKAPISNAEYAAFVAATGHLVPEVDAKTWRGYRLIHPYHRTRRHAWRHGRP
ncbi:MAG: SUMF1/EgtB/PvdO family nonheme iron enzyme, partial [Alphaproteobacteria bacterium]|nr:SUMF1/EgtB/PvdO family nonheme iron enzyme [Alphaproteobacteria bacterium]